MLEYSGTDRFTTCNVLVKATVIKAYYGKALKQEEVPDTTPEATVGYLATWDAFIAKMGWKLDRKPSWILAASYG